MKSKLTKILAFIGAITLSHSLYAGVVTGTIESAGSGPFDVSIDAWTFSQNTAGVSTFDILAYEFDPITSTVVDLNGDGEDTYLDSHIWLFQDDGVLGWDDLVADSDDSALGSDTNGSFADPANLASSLDPFLSLHLAAGDYILLVSSCCGNDMDFVNMVQRHTGLPFHPRVGDYALHFSGDIELTNVSEPKSIMLFGMACLFLLRRKIKSICK